MVAVDVLEVSVLYCQNHYLLVIQDYFTKWAHAIPIPNQTATITAELVKVFSMSGLSKISSKTLTKVVTAIITAELVKVFSMFGLSKISSKTLTKVVTLTAPFFERR